jgi:preprotein translocase subunit SecD
MAGCGAIGDGTYSCRFRFSISLSPEAAKRQGEITSKLDVLTVDEQGNTLPAGNQYLEKQLDLLLDDVLVDSLNIGSDLKGSETTDIQVSGSGIGQTEQAAMFDALENMKKLQTYLSTGSLPVKINIVKTDSISPVLGHQFINNAIFIGILAILGVGIVVFIRYRNLKIAIPIITFSTIEVVLLLGFASIIGWNLDLAAIAGIIIVVGTSVDHQIVISDEILKRGSSTVVTMKQKIKNAFFIIMGAFFTTSVAMIPLVFAGAGLLKGFALTTMIGIFIGVFIARPAFARTVEILVK